MHVHENLSRQINFDGAGISAASYLEKNMLLNKAIVDASVDIPFICLANKETERKERTRRIAVNYPLCFLSPLVSLPLTNRIALKYLTKLTPKFFTKESNIIEISNKYLKDKNSLKRGLKSYQEKIKPITRIY